MLRTLVVPLSGSISSSLGKSTALPLARSLSARLVAASISALRDDGMPQRAAVRMRSPPSQRTIGAA
ncbi:hypothetical protein D3C75_1335010 [compost metagenome]